MGDKEINSTNYVEKEMGHSTNIVGCHGNLFPQRYSVDAFATLDAGWVYRRISWG